MHTDETLDIMQAVTKRLGAEFRSFCADVDKYETVELEREAEARERRRARTETKKRSQAVVTYFFGMLFGTIAHDTHQEGAKEAPAPRATGKVTKKAAGRSKGKEKANQSGASTSGTHMLRAAEVRTPSLSLIQGVELPVRRMPWNFIRVLPTQLRPIFRQLP